MADPVSISSFNPLANASLGSMSTWATVLIIIALAIVCLGLIGLIIYFVYIKREYWIKIHVFRLIGNVPTRVAIYSAREIAFGMAGDKLWKVAPAGVVKTKIIKWLPVGKLQTAPREFWYWIRQDGEWINFLPGDIDDASKRMGVKFIQEDMRLQRLATDRLLEQRHMNKNFWEQWKDTIITVILFLVIAICTVVIFYQFSKLLDKVQPLVTAITNSLKLVQMACPNLVNQTGGLIPA